NSLLNLATELSCSSCAWTAPASQYNATQQANILTLDAQNQHTTNSSVTPVELANTVATEHHLTATQNTDLGATQAVNVQAAEQEFTTRASQATDSFWQSFWNTLTAIVSATFTSLTRTPT